MVVEIATAAEACYRTCEEVLEAIEKLIDLWEFRAGVAEKVLDAIRSTLLLEVYGQCGAVLAPRESKDVPGLLQLHWLGNAIAIFCVHPVIPRCR